MKGKKTKSYLKLGLACLLVFLLTAFGCKSDDQSNTTEEASNTEATTEPVTFSTENSAEVNTTTTPDTANISDTDESNGTVNTSVNSVVNSSESTDTASDDQAKVLKLATSLAEIFGTFTNKDKEPFKNLKDLQSYASKKMSGWINNKVAGASKPDSNAPFYGITTRVLSSAVLESSSTSYQILLTCQREEITEVTSSPKKSYQLLEMNFVKEDKEWKLDGVYWKE